ERELQRAEAVRLEVFADELILAFRLVHRDATARDDAQAVGRLELQIAQCGPEDDAADLRRAVLQREIEMSGVPDPAVRQLAFDPDFEEFLFEEIADADRQLGDREHAPRRSRRVHWTRPTHARRQIRGGRVLWTRRLVLWTRRFVLFLLKRKIE